MIYALWCVIDFYRIHPDVNERFNRRCWFTNLVNSKSAADLENRIEKVVLITLIDEQKRL